MLLLTTLKFFIKVSFSLQKVLLCYGWRGQFVDVKVATKFQCQRHRQQQLQSDCILVGATSAGTRLTTNNSEATAKTLQKRKTVGAVLDLLGQGHLRGHGHGHDQRLMVHLTNRRKNSKKKFLSTF